MPSIAGTLGPWRSASKIPTRYPARCSAAPRFTVVAVFPTPPFPERTAILYLTYWSASAIEPPGAILRRSWDPLPLWSMKFPLAPRSRQPLDVGLRAPEPQRLGGEEHVI